MVRELKTRGDRLAFAISFALIRAVKVVRGLRQGLTDDQRHAVSAAAVSEMKRYGDPWRLGEELSPLTAATEAVMPTGWNKPFNEQPSPPEAITGNRKSDSEEG
jgi:hypothetical protein